MVAGCGFSGSSKQLLGRFCEALQASMAPRRSPMQDWTCFPLYLSMAVWNLLQHTQGQLQKIDGLADYLICELGLRNPSEMTMATVAALLSMHDPNGQAVRSSAQQMYALLQTCRSRFKSVMARARAASREVVAYVQQLPSDTSRLPAQLVQARFPHGFSPAQVDLQELSRHARAWPLRETNNLVRGQGTQQAAATGSDALSLLQQAATVFRAMGLGPRSPRVPVEPIITYLPSTAAGSQLQPVAANGPVASLAPPPSSTSALSLQLPAQGQLAQQGAAQQLQAPLPESAQTDSFESQATVRATDSQIWGPSEEPQVAESQPARADSGSLPTQPDPPCLPASSEDVLQTATPARPELPGSRLAASVEGLAAAHYGRKLHLNSPPMVAKKPSAATSALKRPASACTPCKGTPVVEDGPSFDSPALTGVQASPWSLFRKSADTRPLDERPVPGSPKTPASRIVAVPYSSHHESPPESPGHVHGKTVLKKPAGATSGLPKTPASRIFAVPYSSHHESPPESSGHVHGKPVLKKPAGATSAFSPGLQKSMSGSLFKRPSQAVSPKKRPASSASPLKRPSQALSPKKRPAAGPSSPKKRQLKTTAKCVRSRAYHKAYREAEKQGCQREICRQRARVGYREAVI